MSRLREAFEKAAGRKGSDHQDTAGSADASPAASLPADWDFDLRTPGDPEPAGAPATEATAAWPPHAATLEHQPAAERPHPSVALISDRPAAVAQPRPRDAFWHTYRFGQKGIGKVVVGPGAESALIEQYRRLGAALHHHQLQSGARTLMVTSAVAAEGKTLTATNLALTLSHSYQRRVLLVDADLRRPSVHEILRLPNTTGLSDSLRHP